MIRAEISDIFGFASDLITIRFSARDSDALLPFRVAKLTARDDLGAVLEYEDAAAVLASARSGATLSLSEVEGRALLEALAAHFGGTGPAKAARDDLLHERQRVDKLTDALIMNAAVLAHALSGSADHG